MAALTANRIVLIPNGTIRLFAAPVATAIQTYVGGVCTFDTAAVGVATKATGSVATQTPFGQWTQSVLTSGVTAVGVQTAHEIELNYFNNDSTVTVANSFGVSQYFADDQTVTTTAGTNSHCGRIWIVNAAGVGQVGVQFAY